MAGIVRDADATLGRDAAYRSEVDAWTRTDNGAPDGVSRQSGGPAPHATELLARRDFGGTHAHRADDAREPLVAVLGVFGDWAADEVRAGMALQCVLLTATDGGLAASMFSQPIELPGARERLRVYLGRRHPPQMVLRFGFAATLAASNRRPLTDVIMEPAPPGC